VLGFWDIGVRVLGLPIVAPSAPCAGVGGGIAGVTALRI